MQHVILYTKETCTLCDEAELLLSLFMEAHPFELERRDIYTNDEWLEKYHLEIPVIEINGRRLYGEGINFEAIERLLAGD
ncbi:glutaredoxin family protein [Oceanobacillus sp. FSL K6-2867]|uniref:glutaredoxin family protein n=1 Tax=Oceanobacillus sp. FSL K6-2867 TaxID=2954748 RepID=UPI0030D8872C